MMAVKAHIVSGATRGGTAFADTAVHTGKWSKLTQVGAVNAVISASQSNITGLNGFTLLPGQSIEAIFTSVTLSSGSVIAYPA